MSTSIKERVEVAAVFRGGPGALRPVKFRWNGQEYPVKEVTYIWNTRQGRDKIIHFSVTDGATLFELAYNLADMSWALNKVE